MDNDQANCWNCNSTIDAEDTYCRFCGKGQGSAIPFRYTQAGIIILMLLIGPLALPFIMRSPKLDKTARIVYVAINLLITYFMINAMIDIYGGVLREVRETAKTIST
jgi:hypothetical protein